MSREDVLQQKTMKINELSFEFKMLEKEQQNKPK